MARGSPRARRRNTPTIRDVARLARVGIATASRALSGSGPVSREANDRVRAAVARLGFRPSPSARAMRGKKSKVLGAIVPLMSPATSEWLRGATDAAREHGYLLVVCDAANSRRLVNTQLEQLYSEHVDGLVVAEPLSPSDELRQFLAAGIPIGPDVERGAPSAALLPGVWLPALTAAARDLVAHNHRRIAFCGLGNRDDGQLSPVQALAVSCLGDSLASVGRDLDPALVIRSTELQDGLAQLNTLLRDPGTTTAVVAGVPMYTAGILHVIAELSLEVPGDISVLALDENGWEAAYYRPPLAVVRLDHYALAMAVTRDVICRIERWPVGEPPPAVSAEFEPRGSIGPANPSRM